MLTFFDAAVNELITNKTQNIFIIAEHSAFKNIP